MRRAVYIYVTRHEADTGAAVPAFTAVIYRNETRSVWQMVNPRYNSLENMARFHGEWSAIAETLNNFSSQNSFVSCYCYVNSSS